MPGHVSIRTRLIRDVITVLVVTGVAILLTTFLGARHAVRTLSESAIGQTRQTVEAHLSSFFGDVERELRLGSERIADGTFDISFIANPRPDSDEALLDEGARFARSFAPIISAYPQVSSVMVASEMGHEHMLLSHDETWTERIFRPTRWGSEARWLDWSEQTPPSTRTAVIDYDPHARPWYRDAVGDADAGKAHWTEPYLFFMTGDVGITASRVVEDPDGARYVLGFDVALSDLTDFTQALEAGRNGRVVVLTDDLRVVALPSDPKFMNPTARTQSYLKAPEDLGLTLIRDAAVAFRGTRETEGATRRFFNDGHAWWGRVSPFDLSSERRFWVAVLLPESELLGDVSARRAQIIIVVAIVLIAGLFRAVFVARRISTPIEALVEQTARISRGDLDEAPVVGSSFMEVRRLAAAHDQMRVGLRSQFKLEKLERDLDIAREIQSGLLPSAPPETPGFEIAGWNQPADETGGDYFDWMTLPSGATVITLADVTGHGIGPALIVAVCRAYVRAMASFRESPLAVGLARVNALLCSDALEGRFVTAVVGSLHPDRNELDLLSAGHGPLLFYRAGAGVTESWDADTPPLGVIDDLDVPEPRRIVFEPGDFLVLTTDGFFEWQNPDGEQFGTKRLEAFVTENHHLAPAEFIAALYQAVRDHAKGTDQLDDLTALVVRKL